jgi:hypothetical protein
MTNKIYSWLMPCLICLLSLCSTGSFAISSNCPALSGYPLNGCSLPGVTDGSFPFFDQTISVTYRDKDTEDGIFRIRGESLRGSHRRWLQRDDETTVVIPGMKIKLDIKVDGIVASGVLNNSSDASRVCFLGECRDVSSGGAKNPNGALRITGKMPDLGNFSLLADLKGEWDVSQDSMLWAFDLTNITCSGVLNSMVDCAKDGAIYLNLLEAIGPNTGAGNIKTSGLALTSVTSQVPVPATVWLFSSGLLGLMAISRYPHNQARG